jgi:hypothetical protein
MVGANAADGIDSAARVLADKFNDQLKGTFLVEIESRAFSIIAADLTAAGVKGGYVFYKRSAQALRNMSASPARMTQEVLLPGEILGQPCGEGILTARTANT